MTENEAGSGHATERRNFKLSNREQP